MDSSKVLLPAAMRAMLCALALMYLRTSVPRFDSSSLLRSVRRITGVTSHLVMAEEISVQLQEDDYSSSCCRDRVRQATPDTSEEKGGHHVVLVLVLMLV